MGCGPSSPKPGPQEVTANPTATVNDLPSKGDTKATAKNFGKKEKEAMKKLGNFFRESSYKLQAKKERTWQVRFSRL